MENEIKDRKENDMTITLFQEMFTIPKQEDIDKLVQGKNSNCLGSEIVSEWVSGENAFNFVMLVFFLVNKRKNFKKICFSLIFFFPTNCICVTQKNRHGFYEPLSPWRH